MMAMKLCKGSLAPHIPYPESEKSVMAMTDAEVMRGLQQMSMPLEEDSQARDTVEDKFPGVVVRVGLGNKHLIPKKL